MKKLLCVLFAVLSCSVLFSQSYEEHLAKAKQYESKKNWCYALASYYDAMVTDIDPELKFEALDRYNALKATIKAGNPGFCGELDVFTKHDEWERLLMEAEDFASSFNSFTVYYGDFKLSRLDYENKTATYAVNIKYERNERYYHIIPVIANGVNTYGKFPKSWPDDDSYRLDKHNAFSYTGTFEYEFNIIDKIGVEYTVDITDGEGYELAPCKRFYFRFEGRDYTGQDTLFISGVPLKVMELIKEGKAFLNPVASYLRYGNHLRDEIRVHWYKSDFVPIGQTPKDKLILGKLKEAKRKTLVKKDKILTNENFVEIPELNIKILKTGVTNELYEAVINSYEIQDKQIKELANKEYSFGGYEARLFCNRLSELLDLVPLYTYDETKSRYVCSDNIGCRLPKKQEIKTAQASGKISVDLNEYNTIVIPLLTEAEVKQREEAKQQAGENARHFENVVKTIQGLSYDSNYVAVLKGSIDDWTSLINALKNSKGKVSLDLSGVTGITNIEKGMFTGCDKLIGIVLPNSVTSIGERAFDGCSGLDSVTIPDSVTSIGAKAFSDCDDLQEIHISDLNAWLNIKVDGYLGASRGIYLNGSKLEGNLVIPEGVKEIRKYAFYNCKGLTSVTIPNSVTSIGYGAFKGCKGLTSVTIPNSVTSIGEDAFYSCYSLTSVTIPNSVTSIGGDAFYGCKGLTSVTIPDSVTSIGGGAFYSCYSLTSVTIPDSVTSIGDYAFCNCEGLTSVTIPNSVTSIGYSAFCNCEGLTSVTIPNSVTSIGYYAFSDCDSLTSVTIPNSVTRIKSGAFDDCDKLTEIVMSKDLYKRLSSDKNNKEALKQIKKLIKKVD